MRKGQWLNRPVHIRHPKQTNEHDVAVAKINAIPESIRSLHGVDKHQAERIVDNLVSVLRSI